MSIFVDWLLTVVWVRLMLDEDWFYISQLISSSSNAWSLIYYLEYICFPKISTECELLDLWTGGWRQIWVRFSVEWLERLSRKVLQSTFSAELPSFLPSMQHREKLTSYFIDCWTSALNNFNVISNFFHSHSIQSLMRDFLGFWKFIWDSLILSTVVDYQSYYG